MGGGYILEAISSGADSRDVCSGYGGKFLRGERKKMQILGCFRMLKAVVELKISLKETGYPKSRGKGTMKPQNRKTAKPASDGHSITETCQDHGEACRGLISRLPGVDTKQQG